jgi:hypothetical protein
MLLGVGLSWKRVVFTCVLYRHLVILFSIVCPIARLYNDFLDTHSERIYVVYW